VLSPEECSAAAICTDDLSRAKDLLHRHERQIPV
jgi:hypothetical protein